MRSAESPFAADRPGGGVRCSGGTRSSPAANEGAIATIERILDEASDEVNPFLACSCRRLSRITFDLASNPNWNGVIRDLRIDPLSAAGNASIDSVEFIP